MTLQAAPTKSTSKLIAFTTDFKNHGWCKYYAEKFTSARLYHAPSGTIHPVEYIKDQFISWCEAPLKDDLEGVTNYVMRSLTSVSGTIFKPVKTGTQFVKQNGLEFINTYRHYTPKRDNKPTPYIFLRFLVRLFPVRFERRQAVAWLAHIFQKPQERPTWHLLCTSDVGTGKGFLVNRILQPLLLHTTVITSYEQVFSKHSTVLEHNLLVLLDDPKSKSDATMIKLKSALSEPRVYIEPKNEAGKMVDTFSRFILASNEERPLRLEPSERRWFAVSRMEHWYSKEETQRFIAKLAAWLSKPGSLDSIYHWLMAYDIQDFNCQHVEQSPALLAMIDQSKNALDDFFDHYITPTKVFRYSDLKMDIETEGYARPSDSYLKHALQEKGFKSSRCKNKTVTLWHHKSIAGNTALSVFEASTGQPSGSHETANPF